MLVYCILFIKIQCNSRAQGASIADKEITCLYIGTQRALQLDPYQACIGPIGIDSHVLPIRHLNPALLAIAS